MEIPLPPNVQIATPLPEDHAGFDVSEGRAMQALARAEDRHFWHRARNELLARKVRELGVPAGAKVLELGCGGGCVTAHLSRVGYDVTGVDGHLSLVRRAAERAPGARFVVQDLARGKGPLEGGAYDVVALFDVLEHLEDPGLALESALSLARPGGGFVIGTVPALMALWSQVDVQAGHRLRYERRGLERLLGGLAGARVVEVVPFNRVLVPLLFAQRRVVVKGDVGATSESNLRVPPTPVNHAMLALCRAETRLGAALARTPLPGASLYFAMARV